MRSRPPAPIECHRLSPGKSVRLGKIDPAATPAFRGNKSAGEASTVRLTRELETLQELLWARRRERLLVVLQGMDTSGKDGVIRQVFEGVNPTGVRVASFKAPTEEELARDFLWRIHQRVPAAGEIVIFNRSHYEDVLVVRVKQLVPEIVWRERYRQIVEFERLLTETGTTIVKLFLHISPKEQKQRLEERLANPDKQWKFDPNDLAVREQWHEYQLAYAEALERTSTAAAPWFAIPADRKWYRDFAISSILVETLQRLELRPPAPRFDPATITLR